MSERQRLFQAKQKFLSNVTEKNASALLEQIAAYLGVSGYSYTKSEVRNLVANWSRSPRNPQVGECAWKEVIIEACIVDCISWDENDPRKTLSNLISWENTVALDPRVSKEANDLILASRNQTIKRVRDMISWQRHTVADASLRASEDAGVRFAVRNALDNLLAELDRELGAGEGK